MPIYKKVNKDFFKKWTPEMAYVLGFFAADGYMTFNKQGGGYWCIDIVDKKLIEQIKQQIKANHKISIRKKSGNKYTSYRLQIGSIVMCQDLLNLGFTSKKAKNMVVPAIPDLYFADFIRGYFDGDGHVWVGLVHKERRTQTLAIQSVFTSCSLQFLKDIKLKLEKFGIDNGRIRVQKGSYYRLVYSTRNSLKLYYFMYNSLSKSKLYLKRKKVRFEKYLKLTNSAVVV